jgi:CBS domain containing-hemolysin-like protein
VIADLSSRGFSAGASSAAALAVTSALLLFFGEIMPKNIATTYPQKVSSAFGGFLNFVSYLFRPLSRIAAYFSSLVVSPSPEFSDLGVSRGDIGEISQNLDDRESLSKIISRVLTLNQKKLAEVMTPREKIAGIDLNARGASPEEMMIDSGISRFPVYYGSLDKIAGIVYAREIVKARILEGKIDIKRYARRPLFIDGGVSVLSAYRKLVSERVHIALVTDASGRIAGIATMEDLLEEIFGNILDEYDLKRSAPEK